MREQLAKAIFSGTLLAEMVAGGASVYNQRLTIQSNEKIHTETMKSQEADRFLDADKMELEKYKLGLPSKYSQSANTNSTVSKEEMMKEPISKTSSNHPTEINSNDLTSIKSSNTIQEHLKDILSTNSTDFSNFINASYEPHLLDSSLHNVLQPLFYSYMCFSFVGFFGILCLGLNLLIQHYKNRYESILPKWSHSYLNFYIKYLMLSNVFYILGIIASQVMILGLSIYYYYHGFWLI